MKYLTLLIFVIILSACSSTKRVAENTPKEEQKEEIIIVSCDIPIAIEASPIPNKIEAIEVKNKESIKNTEVKKTPIVVEEKIEETTSETPKIPLPPKPPKQIEDATFSHSRWNKFLQQFVTEEGKINYKKIREDRFQLDIYIDLLSHNLPTEDWTKEDKLAYWVNAYNAMTIDLIIRNYPVKSIKDIKDPWEQRLWELGDKWYNLNEIEHQILRKMNEPRIHFAIVCASFSCPKLQNEAFTASTLETQLTTATKEFLIDSKLNNITKNNLKLSKIFKWFKKDFEENGTLIDFLNIYSNVTISENAKKSYLNYNWDLNE